MKRNKHIIFMFVILVYALTFIFTYGALSYSIMIPSLGLVGMCAWLYGLRIGLVSIVPWVLLNFCLSVIISTPIYERAQAYNPVGVMIAIVFALVIGTLKDSYNKLNDLKSSLAARVEIATNELQILAHKLIKKDEEERIRIGQDLHDGVGQSLTGMLILCEALAHSLMPTQCDAAVLTERMRQRVDESIRTMRKLARSLLPIQFPVTSLENALSEMTDYFREYSNVNIHLDCFGNSDIIPASTAQHLYRILQEILSRAIYKHDANDVEILLAINENDCLCAIRGKTAVHNLNLKNHILSEIMKYRIGSIKAHHSFYSNPSSHFRFECSTRLSE